jgi:hypothetical protein
VDPQYGYKATVGYQGAATAYSGPAYSPSASAGPAYSPTSYAGPAYSPAASAGPAYSPTASAGPAYSPAYYKPDPPLPPSYPAAYEPPPSYRPAYSDYSSPYAYGPAQPAYTAAPGRDYGYAAVAQPVAAPASDYRLAYSPPPRSYSPYGAATTVKPVALLPSESPTSTTPSPPTLPPTVKAIVSATPTPTPEVTPSLDDLTKKGGINYLPF